jgi:hypothetical protein
MKFLTHNDTQIEIGGTHFVGNLIATYDDIIDVFGKPTNGDDYKTDAEWWIEFEDGKVGTIYNWKDGINYCGHGEGIPTKYIEEWHIGGKDSDIADRIQKLF